MDMEIASLVCIHYSKLKRRVSKSSPHYLFVLLLWSLKSLRPQQHHIHISLLSIHQLRYQFSRHRAKRHPQHGMSRRDDIEFPWERTDKAEALKSAAGL